MGGLSKRRQELAVNTHDAYVRGRVWQFCIFVRANFFVTPFMTCRLWIFLEAAAGTIADICTLEFLGRVGWDREPMRPEDSFLERLAQRDQCDLEITSCTLDGHFWVLYQFPGQALREAHNKTVHGFICTSLVSSPNGYILYWPGHVRRPSWLTRPYLVAIEPFRR